MGNISTLNNSQQQKILLHQYTTKKDQKVLQLRSNPSLNEYIPKVFFEYEEQNKQKNLIDKCISNETLPIGIRFQKFIGNLSLLKGKLRFQESLYVLKSLFSGYQVILSFFGKVIVDPNYCFLTKDGQVKAWINQDYRKNFFQNQLKKELYKKTGSQKLFLGPEEWVDKKKETSSVSNIIHSVLLMVFEFTYEKQKYNNFIKQVNLFILNNILKNYNFDRVSKFTSKYIYQKKLFVKSNLLEAIQRIYKNDFEPKGKIDANIQAVIQQKSLYSSSQNHTKRDSDIKILQEEVKLRKCRSGNENCGRSQTYAGNQSIKKSTFFQSTQNSNTNSKLHYFAHHPIQNMKEDHISSSLYSSQCGNFPHSFMKSEQRKNHISPQFSYNCVTKISSSPIKLGSQKLISKNSYTSPTTQNTNKYPHTYSFENHQKQSTQMKQFENLQRQIKSNNSIVLPNHGMATKISSKEKYNEQELQLNKGKVKFSNKIEEQINSMASIKLNLESNRNLVSKPQLKMFKSNCVEAQNDHRTRQNYYTNIKSQIPYDQHSINQKNDQKCNNFTNKTITRLISSNQNLSNQQQSQGQFPSYQNISSYSGILVSMGRSVEVIQVPQQRINFRNKKMKNTFFTNPDPSINQFFRSTEMYQTY